MTLAALAERARSRVLGGGRAIVGITGPPGAGKTFLVDRLREALRPAAPDGSAGEGWVVHVPMDGFHLADVELDRLGRRGRKGAPDTFDSAGYLSVLQRILADTPDIVYVPNFERTIEQPIAGSIAVEPTARLILTEGNYLLTPEGDWPKIRSLMAEVWYLDLDEDERHRRLIQRHVDFGKAPEEASAWVYGPDETNARLVSASMVRADLVIQPADYALGERVGVGEGNRPFER